MLIIINELFIINHNHTFPISKNNNLINIYVFHNMSTHLFTEYNMFKLFVLTATYLIILILFL